MSLFSAVAKTLRAITMSGKNFRWGNNQQRAFEELKKKINEAPIMVLPNLQQLFEVEIDVSEYVTGVGWCKAGVWSLL